LAVENVAEYLTPISERASIVLGYAIVAGMVCTFAVAAAIGAYRAGTVRGGVTAAVWAALCEYLIWYATLLLTYHAFVGTGRWERAMRAEGTYDDFGRGGLTDLHAFVVQDYLGAGFFHLVVGVVIAAVIGLFSALLAAGVGRWQRRAERPRVPVA
jgi:hypothetical protein